MTLIQVQNVTVVLADTSGRRAFEVRALDEASLTVRSGEVMGVVGPTGCGKTTLLRVIAGLEKPQSGHVLFDGVDQSGVPAYERGIGMVFQDYALYPHYSVLDNLAFYFKLRHREQEVPERVQQAAEVLNVDFSVLLGRFPRSLSVGQRQQVAVARCLIHDPKIFLMDEPFANLDAAQRHLARVQVKRLLQRFRVTTLHVTHDQHEAAALCDRVAVMIEGRIHQVDTFAHLLTWPVDLDVAQFIAEPGTQFVEGACMEGHFTCPAFQVPLLPAVRVRATPGQALLLRVRPAAVSLATAATGNEATANMTVEWIEPLPMQRQKRALCRAGAAALSVELPEDLSLHVGDQLKLGIDPEGVEVFDFKSGVNLGLRAAPASRT